MNRIKTLILIICFVLAVPMLIAGCADNADEIKPSEEDLEFLEGLTDREKSILGEDNIERYPYLPDNMKKSRHREVILGSAAWSYLEEKYPECQFSYQSEAVRRKGPDGFEFIEENDNITVTVIPDYEDGDSPAFSDNYREKLAEPDYEEEMRSFFSQYFSPDEIEVDAEIAYLEEGEGPLLTRAQADSYLVIRNNDYEILYVMEAVEDYKHLLEDSQLPQFFRGGPTFLEEQEFDDMMEAAPNKSFGLKKIFSNYTSRKFAVITGTDNEGMYLDGSAVIIKDGQVLPSYAADLDLD